MKKYILGLVLIATLVVVPIVSSGATIEELLAQIAALQAQIEAMQGSGSDGPATTPITGPTTSGQPEVKVLGSSLMLSGLLGNELSLRANFSVKVTAKDGDIYLPKVRPFWLEFNSPTLPPKNGGMPSSCSWIETPTLKMDTVRELNGNDFYVLPKGKTTNFNLSVSCKTSEMFAGSYTGRLAGFSFANTNPTTWVVNTWPTTYVVINSLTNRAITVIGEKGPWIKTATVGAGETGFLYNLQGERFTKDSIVYVDGQRYADISSNNMTISASYTGLYFGTSQLSSGYHNVYVQNKIGKSNTVTLQIGNVSNQPYVTIGAVSSSGTKLENNSTIKVGDKFTIQGAPYNTVGLVVDRSFIFDSAFDNSCTVYQSAAVYQMDCTATKTGSSNFSIEIYVNGTTYRSDTFTVNVEAGKPFAPTITSATARVRADNSMVDVTIRGEKFADVGNIVKIGTKTLTMGITQIGSEFLLSMSIPRSQMPDGNYPVTVEVPGKGVSDVVNISVGVLGTSKITYFDSSSPMMDPSKAVLSWKSSENTDANIRFLCTSASAFQLYSKEDGKTVTCDGGTLVTYQNQSQNSISLQAKNVTQPVTVNFTLTLLNNKPLLGEGVTDTKTISVTFYPPVSTNLLQNGDFSAGQANWNFIKVVPNVLRNFDGAYNTSNSGEIIYQTVLTKPGTTYEYGAKVKSNLTSGVCQVDVYGSSVDTDVINSYGVQNKGWSDTFVARGASVQIRILNTAIVPNVAGVPACSYDDLYLKPVTTTAKATTINQLASALASLKALIQALR